MRNIEPIKWKKYKILTYFKLRDYDNLVNEVKRYKSKDIKNLILDIKESMNDNDILYVIQLIKNYQLVNIPNRRIRTIEDLRCFANEVEQNNLCNKYDEIWYNKTQINENNRSVLGRVSFSTLIDRQILEQIWNSSPRILNEVSFSSQVDDEYDLTYWHAEREKWNKEFETKRMYPKNISSKELDIYEIDKQYTIKKIQFYRKEIEAFREYLKLIGIREFSLEYKMDNDQFRFIDFDSDNDKLVINRVIKDFEKTIQER